MRWDIIVRDTSIWNWPIAWKFSIVSDDVILGVRESPHNVYAREEMEEVYVDCLGDFIKLWNNEVLYVFTKDELISFLRSLNTQDVDVEAGEWIEDSQIREVLDELNIVYSRYPIYD